MHHCLLPPAGISRPRLCPESTSRTTAWPEHAAPGHLRAVHAAAPGPHRPAARGNPAGRRQQAPLPPTPHRLPPPAAQPQLGDARVPLGRDDAGPRRQLLPQQHPLRLAPVRLGHRHHGRRLLRRLGRPGDALRRAPPRHAGGHRVGGAESADLERAGGARQRNPPRRARGEHHRQRPALPGRRRQRRHRAAGPQPAIGHDGVRVRARGGAGAGGAGGAADEGHAGAPDQLPLPRGVRLHLARRVRRLLRADGNLRTDKPSPSDRIIAESLC